jgi:hypothetical protein
LIGKQQGGEELVAQNTAGSSKAVGLGGMVVVIQPGPVDSDEGKVATMPPGSVCGGLEQRLGETGEGEAWVVVETPGGLRGSLGGGFVGQDAWPGSTGVGVAEMFVDE